MATDLSERRWRLTMPTFHAFRDERPKEEKWELIDGVPVMMPPPTLVHQRISRTIGEMLNARLRAAGLPWIADHEIGLLLPADETFNPEPDLTVIDRDVALDQIYAERFYIVVEVLSTSDKPGVIAAKLDYYKSHAPCLAGLFVRQDRVEATLHARETDGWCERVLSDGDAPILLPEVGAIGPLGACYRDTPLGPR